MNYEIKRYQKPTPIDAKSKFSIAKIMEDGTVYEIENTIIQGAYRCSLNINTSSKEGYDLYGRHMKDEDWEKAMKILITQVGLLSCGVHETGEDGN